MAEHSATVTINAPVHQVYELYTHFNDYPKFMTFVKEVTYLDDLRSHWVVAVVGKHEWDAVNEGWIPDQQVGWRAVDGLTNSGRVRFEPSGTGGTRLTVNISYEPPAGLLGQLGEALGAGGKFDRRLQHDLQHFATMVEEAPSGALDPASSSYLFHAGSAAAAGRTTQAQNETMGTRGNDGGIPPSTTSVADEALTEPGVPRIPGTSATPGTGAT
jgi:uncharacterized membrane protein